MGIKVSKEHGLNPSIGVCPLCGNENGEIYLLGHQPGDKKAPMYVQHPNGSTCKTCTDYKEKGIVLVIVEEGSNKKQPNRTGKIVVIKEEAAAKIFGDDVLKHRAAFIEKTIAEKLGIS